MMNKISINKMVGFVGILLSIIILLSFNSFSSAIIDFSRNYLSQDQNITFKSVLMIKIFLWVVLSVIFIISLTFALNLNNKLFQVLCHFFQLRIDQISNICSKKQIDLYILFIGTTAGIAQIILLLIFGETRDKSAQPHTLPEGNLEILFAIILFISIILILYSVKLSKNIDIPILMKRRFVFICLLLSGILFIFLAEELSWGQQVFKWNTPDVINAYSYQDETNLHNLFNPYMKYIYPFLGTGFFFTLIIIWSYPKMRKAYLFNLLFPHPSLFFLAIMVMLSSFLGGGGELFEQLMTTFFFLYSYRIYMCLKFPNVYHINNLS